MTSGTNSRTAAQLSPEAQGCSTWLRLLGRALKVFRLYRADNPIVIQAQDAVTLMLHELVAEHGDWELRFSASTISLGDEVVVRTGERAPGEDAIMNSTDPLPFLFYRDGIRRITLFKNVPRAEVDSLIDSIKRSTHGCDTQDDLVTLLWQASLTGIKFEAVPLEQTIYLSTHAGEAGPLEEKRGQSYAITPSGSEIRSDIGQMAGAQGLHRDTFDDWPLPEESVDVAEAYGQIEPLMEAARLRFSVRWERELVLDWKDEARALVSALITLDSTPGMRAALTRAIVTWIAAALERAEWAEAEAALELLQKVDPDRSLRTPELTAALDALDARALVERLDDSDMDPARFPALLVELGTPALGFACSMMAWAGKSRSRAAACTALCFMTAENPELLAPWLADSRWHVVRNVVFVLGHIGGAEVVPLLRTVARHPEPRVLRQLVSSLGSVPPEARTPLLIGQLDTRDAQLLSAALNMLTREKNPVVSRAILKWIEAGDFESRSEGNQRALFGALAEVAQDEVVPALEALLYKGGWFARRSLARVAAARALRRIDTEQAMAVLEAGARSKNDAVRSACVEALGSKGKA